MGENEINVTVGTKSGPISALELADFLYLFDFCYFMTVQIIRSKDVGSIVSESDLRRLAQDIAKDIEQYHQAVQKDGGLYVDLLERYDSTHAYHLTLKSIFRENPTHFIFYAMLPPVAAVALIVGGIFSLNAKTIVFPDLKTTNKLLRNLIPDSFKKRKLTKFRKD
ncbi:hypothetical protein [Janthinobacterium sp. SUN033]|uniref:hypothetical protein n=1 Tax=Janthinobacterium sp. SUN033 TaxID=3002439 RepID=UPI0025AF89E5|nr:hypothetical protein [Janthinobacterium sp. SUN033]MDN2676843.1 hypothetical protein [Janthinobacterium sp. SUN033]